jgi:RNA polymerase sigma-54 factor
MALEQKLSLKLSQRLVMTPSLQQAIKLLQMTRMELETTVAQELEENPVLEELEPTPEEEEEEQIEAGTTPAETPTEVAQELDAPNRTAAEEASFEAWLSESWSDEDGSAGEWEEREAPPIENTLTRTPDLYDHLLWQIHLSDCPPRERAIAESIVGNLNPDGFLVASVDELVELGASAEDGAWSEEEVQAALARVRALDPPGIACTSNSTSPPSPPIRWRAGCWSSTGIHSCAANTRPSRAPSACRSPSSNP